MNAQRFDVPFPHWTVDGLNPEGLDLEQLSFDAANEITGSLCHTPGDWKYYRNELERKCLVDDAADVGLTCQLICQYPWQKELVHSLDAPTKKFVPAPTGYGGAIHAMLPGDYLGCHLDRELLPNSNPLLELRLAVVVFLVFRWEESWGGALCFHDEMGAKILHKVYPQRGRIVFWLPDNLAYHSVERVSEDCPVVRGSANCFFYAPARPEAVRRRALFVPYREHEQAAKTHTVHKPYPRSV